MQIKVAEQDKLKMVEILRSKRSEDADIQSDSETIMEQSVPPLTQVVGENDGWITVDRPMVYIYAGQGPYVGRYVKFFGIDSRFSHTPLVTLCNFLCHCQTME